MFERKEFQVQVNVIEGRYIKAPEQGGCPNPYIKITCGNLEPQVTVMKEQSNMAIWNQSFTFDHLLMNDFELETWELLFEAYNRNTFFTDSLLGSCSIGLGTMYRNNKEFYRCWLSLFNSEKPKEAQGYLMVSCYIVGPGDKAPIHAEGELGMGDIDYSINTGAVEEMSIVEKRIKIQREKNIVTVGKPGILKKSYQLTISFYKAEGLPPDSNSFIAVRCCGVVLKTPILEPSENPFFQTSVLFPVNTPFLNDNISIKIWNYYFGRANLLIAQVCDEYGLHSDFNLSTLMKVGKVIGTRWYNLYSVRDDHRDIYGKRTKEGKEYVGRVLMRASLISTDNPIMGVVRSNIGREPKSANYLLFVDVFTLRNVIGLEGKIWIVASFGNSETKRSSCPEYSEEQKSYIWKSNEKQQIATVEGVYPLQPEQCPDIFLYLFHEVPTIFSNSSRCAGYARIRAKDCMSETPQTRWIAFKSVVPNADCPGDLLCNIQLSIQGEGICRMPIEPELINYRLIIQVRSGFYVAPDIEDESKLNTFVEVYVGKNETFKSENAKGRYPIW